MSTPIYDDVATDLGWSLDDLAEPFDLDGALAYAGELARERQRLGVDLRRLFERRVDETIAEIDL